MTLDRQELAERAASLAAQGVYIGTSSWKYRGWCGMLYDPARYEYRGRFAEARFKRDCLREYAEGPSESEPKPWRQIADGSSLPSGARLCRTAGRLYAPFKAGGE